MAYFENMTITNGDGSTVTIGEGGDRSDMDLAQFGITSVPDPDGREAYASNVVTSLQQRRINGVTLRDLLGENYTPSHDASVALSGFLAELAPEGIAITDPHGTEVLLEAPWRPQSGMRLLFSPHTTIKKGWSGASSDTDALMAAASAATDVDDFLIDGGIWKAASASQTGRIFTLYGDRWEIRNARIIENYSSQALVFGGDDIRLNNIYAKSGNYIAGTGSFRMIYGRGMRAFGLYGECGDDVFQFVPSTSSTNPRFNQSISDSYYIGCHGISHDARLLVAAIAGPQDENLMTATIRRVGWIGCSGKGGQRTVVVECTEGDGTVQRQVDEVLVSGCMIDGSAQGQEQDQDGLVIGSFAGAIGRVTFRDSQIFGTKRRFGLSLASEGASILLDNCVIEGEQSALEVRSPCAITLRDGRLAVKNNGGGNTANHAIVDTVAAGDWTLTCETRPRIEGVATGKAGIRLNSASAKLRADDLAIYKASGATGTTGINYVAGARVHFNAVRGDVATEQSGSGELTRPARDGSGNPLTIASGSITLAAPLHRVETESSAASDDLDTVVFPSWAREGDLFRLMPFNDTRTVVVKHGTGNIRCGADITLDNLNDIFVGMKSGSNLIRVGFGDNGA